MITSRLRVNKIPFSSESDPEVLPVVADERFHMSLFAGLEGHVRQVRTPAKYVEPVDEPMPVTIGVPWGVVGDSNSMSRKRTPA